MRDNNLHHPPHIFIDDSWYFITAHTISSVSVLKDNQAKMIWTAKLHEISKVFDVRIYAYVLLDDHYHFLGYFAASNTIPKFIHRLHGTTSYLINKRDHAVGRQVWHNYWDRVIRDEAEFYTKVNYIHHNPVKHGSMILGSGSFQHISFSCRKKERNGWGIVGVLILSRVLISKIN